MGKATDITIESTLKLSVPDRAQIQDDFRMIFSLEGNVLPHIADLFQVFEVKPEHADLFMDYYGSQILRLDQFGTVEAEFGQNLVYANLAKTKPAIVPGIARALSVITLSDKLLSDIARFKRRVLLMTNQPEITDCFVSEDPAFESEQYMFTQDRLNIETSGAVTDMFLARATRYKKHDA